MDMKEGHPAYRSQSDNPGKGTTLGGRTNDPRREHTRNAAAGDPSRERGRCERGLSGSGDLADPVLSMAKAADALWRRRPASAAALRAPWTPATAVGARRAADPGDL